MSLLLSCANVDLTAETMGTVADWIGLIIAGVAAFAALRGFFELIRGKKDMQAQIDAMSKVAINMAELATQQKKENDAMRLLNLPHLRAIGWSVDEHQLSRQVRIHNFGGPLHHLELINEEINGITFNAVQRIGTVLANTTIEFSWFTGAGRISSHLLRVRIRYMESYGKHFEQVFEVAGSQRPTLSEPLQINRTIVEPWQNTRE